MPKELISVIVPVYNVENYLERCICSIVNQSYSNIEIILVNDGSTDSSLDICFRYSLNDSKIKIVNQANGGLSAARNAGLGVSSGKYIVFIDSDDHVNVDYIAVLYKCISEKKCDVAICDYSCVYDDKLSSKYLEKYIDYESEYKVLDNTTVIKNYLMFNNSINVVSWNKMYRSSVIKNNGILFPVGKIHEDNFTTYKIFYYSNKIAYINSPLYFYTKRPDSIMGVGFSEKSLDMITAADETVDFVKDKLSQFTAYAEVYRINIIITAINLMMDSNNRNVAIWQSLKNKLLKSNREVGMSKGLRAAAYVLSARFGYTSYSLVRKLFKMVKEMENNNND